MKHLKAGGHIGLGIQSIGAKSTSQLQTYHKHAANNDLRPK